MKYHFLEKEMDDFRFQEAMSRTSLECLSFHIAKKCSKPTRAGQKNPGANLKRILLAKDGTMKLPKGNSINKSKPSTLKYDILKIGQLQKIKSTH